jgi:hypothetical protein
VLSENTSGGRLANDSRLVEAVEDLGKPAKVSKDDLALAASKRLLDSQFSSINAIQTKVGVLLGFAVSTLGILFSLGVGWVSGHQYLALIPAVLLLASVLVLTLALITRKYTEVPDPFWLWKLLNAENVDGTLLRKKLISNYTGAFEVNRTDRIWQFKLVNSGIVLLLLGIGSFVFAVLAFP